VLDTLQRENMPPVYGFVNGQKVERQPRWLHILQMWHAAGEPLGNHTWSHPEFDAVTVPQYEKDITRNEGILKQVDPGGDWHWFRFPYLEEGATVEKREALRGFLRDRGYRIAEVSLDFQDYLWNDPYQRCTDKHRTVDMQWLHDSYLAAATQAIAYGRTLTQRAYGRDIPYVLLLHLGAFDAKMLPELIALFRSQGFAFVTLPQAQSDPAYSDSEDPAVDAKGGGLLEELEAVKKKVGFPDSTSVEEKLDHLCR
jgi:peptidoglycan-N-acetylglucosamine deacetylase